MPGEKRKKPGDARDLMYIYDSERREFMVRSGINLGAYRSVPVGHLYTTWTPSRRYAQAFTSAGAAYHRAARINAERGRDAVRVVPEVLAERYERANDRERKEIKCAADVGGLGMFRKKEGVV